MPPEAPEALLCRIMDTYGRAWETHDPELVLSVFAEDATYRENPFSEPMAGHAAIRHYWEQATGPHRDVQFHWDALGASCGLHFVEWSCTFTRSDVQGRIELRGIMLIELRGERIFRFREYWVRQQNSAQT
jgi:ketosteroid isomerase-like protein